MITTIFRISWLNLRRDRVALGMTFVLPLAFFSIFASVFGAMDEEALHPITTVLAVEDSHPVSLELERELRREPGLEIVDFALGDQSPGDEDLRARARELVAGGRAAIGVVIPTGFGEHLVVGGGEPIEIELLSDRSHPIAAGLVGGLVRAAVLRLGIEALSGGAMGRMVGAGGPEAEGGPLTLRVVDVLGEGGKEPSVAFFAAGIGVMFLLFAVSGRSAILIEERESGVLRRLLAARVSLTQLLVGRWLFLATLGALQVTVMFVWASLVFGLELWTPRHLTGFLLMTTASAAVAAAFGLVLSTACRSRVQLNGVAAVVILILSAIGGNMFPSFLMPENLQKIGRLTFNAWSLEGYQKVFWYEAGVVELWPQIAVLLGFSLVFLAGARFLASRW